jgi:HEAT repeat protein
MQETEAAQIDKLLAHFEKGAKLYFEGRDDFNRRKQSKGLDAVSGVARALDAIGDGRRDALIPLLEHEDEGVRAQAAVYLIETIPERALAMLQKIDAGYGSTASFAMLMLYIHRAGDKIGTPLPRKPTEA